jgi:hypothetical protein
MAGNEDWGVLESLYLPVQIHCRHIQVRVLPDELWASHGSHQRNEKVDI